MTRTDYIYREAEEICWILFGQNFHDLAITSYPRVASVYVATRTTDGDLNIFETLKVLTDAVHRYNRNLKTSLMKEDGHGNCNTSWDKIIEEIDSRGIRIHPGGSVFEQVTGRSEGRQAGEVVLKGQS